MNPPLAIAFAVGSAIMFGAFSVMVRSATRSASPFAGVLISLLIGLPMLVVLSLFYSDWSQLTFRAALWFAIGGILAPGLGRMMLFMGIRYIGVGRAMPFSTLTPFLSTLVAVVWLAEQPGIAVLMATLLVVGGCALLSMKPVGDSDWRRIFLLLPVGHSVAMAFSTTSRRYALDMVPDSIIGATIATAVSIPALFLFLPFLPKEERFHVDRRALRIFLVSGLLNTLSYLLFFTSFRYGAVYLVVPFAYTAPLFALIFSYFWLRGMERLTWQKWGGALLLIAGVLVILQRAL
ncbi:MAG: DMT family transporter [bacterium]|nr:DMT family transporter [bacterium]